MWTFAFICVPHTSNSEQYHNLYKQKKNKGSKVLLYAKIIGWFILVCQYLSMMYFHMWVFCHSSITLFISIFCFKLKLFWQPWQKKVFIKIAIANNSIIVVTPHVFTSCVCLSVRPSRYPGRTDWHTGMNFGMEVKWKDI